MAREKDMAQGPAPSIEAAEYVLGTMDQATRIAFQRRLKDDTALRAEVIYWENRLAPLADDVKPVAPPASVLRAIEQQLFADQPQRQAGLWHNLAFWRGLSLAAVAAAVILGGLTFSQVFQTPSGQGTLIATVAGEGNAVRLAVAYDPAEGTLKLNRVAGEAAQGRAFELWLIAGGNAPVSLGVLPQTAQGTIIVPERLRANLSNAVLAISDEPLGGSPTGQPTGAVLATGEVLTIS